MNTKFITSAQISNNDVGRNLSYTYSEVDDLGRIVRSNVRGRRIILNVDDIAKIDAVISLAQNVLDENT